MQVLIDTCREKLQATPQEARRLFHGRGHYYPGLEHLVVNWYPPCLHIGVYGGSSLEALQPMLEPLLAQLDRHCAVEGVVIQFRDGRATHSVIYRGQVPEDLLVLELGLSYWLQPHRNQNAGLFLDMGHVREWLATRVEGKKVLNLFAYTCAFSVSAIAHGAELVVNNDMSKNALAWGQRNHEANDHDMRRVRMIPHNLFKSWWKVKQYGPYDVVIIDPPTNQKGSFVAEKSYGQVLKRLPDLCAPNAVILACLNSPFLDDGFIEQQMEKWCPDSHLQGRLPQHPDFPDKYPERALKVLEYTYTGQHRATR